MTKIELPCFESRIAKLGGSIDPAQLNRTLGRMHEVSSYYEGNPEFSKMRPAVKGFELGIRAMAVLLGKQEHETIPQYDKCKRVDDVPRPFSFVLSDSDKTDPLRRNLGFSILRGFRMALFVVGGTSDEIEYNGSFIAAGQVKRVATSHDGSRVLIGQKITSNRHNSYFETGLYGAPDVEGVFYAVYGAHSAYGILSTVMN